MAGWSHRTPAADAMIREHHAESATICPMLETFVNNGIDAIMGLFSVTPAINMAIKETEQKLGKKIIKIDTPIINVEDSAAGRAEAEAMIKLSKENGATFCLLHHSSVEQLVDKGRKKIHRLDDYTKMIRDNGMIPGLSAHMPEIIVYSDLNEYDVETYIQIYNAAGFLMQVEIETVNQIIRNAKKPVMTIKSMAAGRCSPFVGITFNYATIRDCDMVTIGAFTPAEVHEDVEIAMAAIERRAPDLARRSSPNQTAVTAGKIK
jgi:hypothetical protein